MLSFRQKHNNSATTARVLRSPLLKLCSSHCFEDLRLVYKTDFWTAFFWRREGAKPFHFYA